MPGQLRVIDCELCAPPVADPGSPLRLVTNRVITSSEELLLVADHAPMTLGHLLLMPREHHTAMASFIAARPAAAAVIRDLTRSYRRAFGGCTVIEHGSSGSSSRTSACVDHAHWHLFPFVDELGPIVEDDYGSSMRSVDSLTDLARSYATADYLLYWDTEGARVTALDAPPLLPQYARSVVARRLDAFAQPYDWDWVLRADDKVLVQTLAVARRLLATNHAPVGCGADFERAEDAR